LVVEDQALIAMALQVDLEEIGLDVAGPFPSWEMAHRWLDGNAPAAALLDYELIDGDCKALARALRERGIPFGVYSGHSREREAPPEFQGVPWLDKPVGRARLQATMAGLVPDLRAEAARR
jgi:DNA-binding response OmpR family regulator